MALWMIFFLAATQGIAQGAENTFNQLLLEKSTLEKKYAIKTLECFPFLKKIGLTQDQIPLIENCLAGVQTLKEALAKIPPTGYRVFGISSRFSQTGGFHSALVPWNASKDQMIEFLSHNLSAEEKKQFLNKIHALKQTIAKKIKVNDLYCTLEISNDQCLAAYQNLAAIEPGDSLKKMTWRVITITTAHSLQKDPFTLALAFDNSSEDMLEYLQMDVDKLWSVRKRGYDAIQTQFGQAFKERLQLENFFCSPDLSVEECQQGASNLFAASESDVLQERFWGKLTIDRHNTIRIDDFNATLRFDLPAAEIIQHFSKKPSRQEATRNTIVAEKSEGRSKNNNARLRGVCDLSGLRSKLCAVSFQNFIDFLKKNREYRVARPWTDLMFVDGTQLSRVNFALNSSSRDTYIYIDANSEYKEFESYLKLFQSTEKETE